VSSNLHVAWARLFMRALATSGVTSLVVSPGSRSTPLVLAAAEESGLTCHVVVDERSAAFFALGQARLTGAPTALLCTSGTAGAHYFPAIIEAAASFVPLVVVTADRPWEAYDAAAPQTIDQTKLFGAYVRHFAELGLPDASATAMRAVVRIAAQAVERSLGPTPGPVHVNARFRKPLEPVPGAAREAWHDAWDALMAKGAPRVHAAHVVPADAALADVAAVLSRATRGLIVCGPEGPSCDADARREAVVALARATGFSLFAEATSQVRFGGAERGVPVLGALDAMLRDPASRAALAADVVVEIGAPATSGAYATFLAEQPPAHRVVLAAHGWNDPAGGATDLVRGEPTLVCRALAARVVAAARSASDVAERAEAAVWSVVHEELEEGALTEGRVARDVVDALPEGGVLVLSNSNPVRDVDTYAAPTKHAFRVVHQRGASGIDGLLSTAAGARAATPAPVALLVGDLAFVHDVGGLAQVRRSKGPLAIVVVQNGGGRIFEQLPIARATDAATLSRFFVTPEPVNVAGVAAAFGVRHVTAHTPAELSTALRDALASEAPIVIEAVVEPNAAARRARVWSEWPRRLA
jgi:2-succinyl-5-enolpyruvyl-6-hydroxy-3-cyclohexene-1-carboxylate synthase